MCFSSLAASCCLGAENPRIPAVQISRATSVKPSEVPVTTEPAAAISAGQIEITLASGHRLMLSGAVDVEVVLRLARGLAAP